MSSVIARPDSQVEEVFLKNKNRNNIDDIDNLGGRRIVRNEPDEKTEAENKNIEDKTENLEIKKEVKEVKKIKEDEDKSAEKSEDLEDLKDLKKDLKSEDEADNIEVKEAEPENVKAKEAENSAPEEDTKAQEKAEVEPEEEGMFTRDVIKFLSALEGSLKQEQPLNNFKKIFLGFDLGTTNLVLVALNEDGKPVSAVMEASGSSVRDGVVVDYMGAIHGMQKCLDRLHKRLGDFEAIGAAAYPPGISLKTAKVCSNVVESLGYDCGGLYEEPVAAAESLAFKDAAIVDIGGGTTGISVLQDGQSVYTADEPTGGTHMTLVLSGNMGISFEEAEQVKRDPSRKKMLVPILKPVLEKMGSIIKNHLEISGYFGKVPIIVCGGGAVLPTAEEILTNAVGAPVVLAPSPLLVTPAGIALSLEREIKRREASKRALTEASLDEPAR